MCDRKTLEAGRYNNLTHLYNPKSGEFYSQQIGSFVDFYTREEDGVLQLCGTARVSKRYKEVCEAIGKLHENKSLFFSYEIHAETFKAENGIQHIDRDDSNYLFGMCLVSEPACKDSVSLQLVAELSHNDIRMKIHKAARDYFNIHCPHIESSCRDIWIKDVYADYAIGETYFCDYEPKNYKIYYNLNDEEVTISSVVEVELKQEWIEKNTKEKNDEMDELKAKITQLENALAEKDNVITAKDTEIAELNGKIVSIGEELEAEKGKVDELNTFKAELDVIKAEKETAEKTAKIAELKARAEKVLNETELAELADDINNLDEAKVNRVLADKYVAIAEKGKQGGNKDVNIASRITDSPDPIADKISKYITLNNR